ncbi:MAG TPA: hypothetical protein DIW37_16715 [Chryseobacterium sp.]|nr:hypothetical protein [Chryseobacterium sp.]
MINRVELISLLSDEVLNITPPEGNFSKSNIAEAAFDQIYFTVSTPSFTEDGKDTESGMLYTQEFSLKFPTNTKRKEILNRFRELKIIRLHYCNGKYTDIGRNDFYQNKSITAAFSTDRDFTMMKWIVTAIFPFEYQD